MRTTHLLLFQNTLINIAMRYITLTYPAFFIANTVENCCLVPIRRIKNFSNKPIDTEKRPILRF
ncbi:unknown protein [Microcystis aeruginosa NIES-843]|uniref:Uncharacterized protein n=1 Tax=Microcystis aeruginosa (strain NIES-843 / IAM M-2473) TaxID=449447 RepID=B0JI86_MICAN|nr:unknown protein [Microcystis aeruginosa NIES-843]